MNNIQRSPETIICTRVLKATSKIPVVSVGGGDPVALGTAKTLAQPGGNLTGMESGARR